MSKTHDYDRHFDKSVYDKQYFEGDGSTSGYTDYMLARGIVQDQFSIIARVMSGRLASRLPRHLDVACAYGFGCQYMKQVGYDSEGVDVSEWAIGKAKELAPDIRFGVNDAVELDNNGVFGKQEYDLITAIEFFEHIETGDAQKIIRGMSKYAKWGFFVINASTYPDQPHDTDGDHGHLNHHPMEWWIGQIAQYGQIDFEAMFEFNKEAEQMHPEVHWHNRCVIVKFDKLS